MAPEYTKPYHDKARILVKMQKMEEAIECYNEILTLKPELPELYFYKGINI